MTQQHPLERRATMLAGRLTDRVKGISQSLMAAQGRVPFHTKMSQNDALKWWSAHRYDNLGAQALKQLDPLATAQLDHALTQYTQQQESLGLPVESAAMAAQGGTPDALNPG